MAVQRRCVQIRLPAIFNWKVMLDYKMWANTLIAIMLTLAPHCLSCFSQEVYRALFGKQPHLKLSVVHEIIRRIKQTQKYVEYAKIKPFFWFLLFQLLFNVALFARGQSSPPGCRPELLLNVQTQFYLRPQAKQSRSLELATI